MNLSHSLCPTGVSVPVIWTISIQGSVIRTINHSCAILCHNTYMLMGFDIYCCRLFWRELCFLFIHHILVTGRPTVSLLLECSGQMLCIEIYTSSSNAFITGMLAFWFNSQVIAYVKSTTQAQPVASRSGSQTAYALWWNYVFCYSQTTYQCPFNFESSFWWFYYFDRLS